MRSVVVVLPASMWAMMPMFLQRSNGTVLGTTLDSFWAPNSASLPSVMRERLIGLRHTVYILFLLDCGALPGGGVQQLITQLVDHALLTARPGIGNQPADRERRATVGIHFHRYLIVRSTHAPALDFQ